ncbi:MAG: hypothetical protein ACK5LS_11590 [Propioniciclava sp.]
MSNLGRYQEIVEAAKEAGGVDTWIRRIEDGAVARETPRIVVVTAVSVVAACATVVGGIKLVRGKRAEKIAAGERAKDELRSLVEQASEDDETG